MVYRNVFKLMLESFKLKLFQTIRIFESNIQLWNYSCIDIDECEEENDCEYGCENFFGGFECLVRFLPPFKLMLEFGVLIGQIRHPLKIKLKTIKRTNLWLWRRKWIFFRRRNKNSRKKSWMVWWIKNVVKFSLSSKWTVFRCQWAVQTTRKSTAIFNQIERSKSDRFNRIRAQKTL